MAKYTTLVRSICEQKAGLTESVGFSQIDSVLDQAWSKIFTTNVSFWDESYRAVLCKKILKHYYMREIGAETAGLWQLWINTTLEEIMPVYNKMYEAVALEYNPLHDVDVKRTHTRTTEGSRQESENTGRTINVSSNGTVERVLSNTSDTSVTTSGNTSNTVTTGSTDAFSETPQGGLTGLESMDYLTNARKIDGTQTDTGTSSGTDDTNVQASGTDDTTTKESSESEDQFSRGVKGSNNSTEDYVESVVGKQGAQSYASMVKEYIESLKNIDRMVIDEFKDCFMLLW